MNTYDVNLNDLKQQYFTIPIPNALDDVTRAAIERASLARRRALLPRSLFAAAAVLVACMLVLNLFPASAQALSKLPVLSSIISVLTFGRFAAKSDEQQYEVNIEVPQITGLSDETLQNSLNKKYLAQSKSLYDDFMKRVQLENGELMHQALDAGYNVMARTDNTISILHYVVEIGASGAEKQTFDTIDTQNQVLLTLPGLFRDDSYIERISENILSQMQQQMDDDDSVTYFIGDDGFTGIDADQQFYINEGHQLVIVFDEYAVAPGCMGVVEFTIPTDVISDLLVGNEYIR